MKTADELTALTLDYLVEHSNEAALAVVLGVIWHIIWERPKYLPYLNSAQPSPDLLTSALNEMQQTQPGNNDRIQKTSLLRGNLKKDLQFLLQENRELERLVQELRSEMEQNGESKGDIEDPSSSMFKNNSIGLGLSTSTSISRKRIRSSDAGIVRTAIALTTYEVDQLVSCWTILVFGFCLISSRRKRKRDNPLSKTIELLKSLTLSAYLFTHNDVVPALSKINLYFETHLREYHSHLSDPNSSFGQVITLWKTRFVAIVRYVETLLWDRLFPTVMKYHYKAAASTHKVYLTIASIEFPQNWDDLKFVLKRKERPPTILLSEHNDKLERIKESLEIEISQRKALEEKTEGLEKALKGKEVLLYEERMKTRKARLDSAIVALEREETKREEFKKTRAAALALVAEDQKRLLRGFLREHVLSKQQQNRLRKIDQQNNPQRTSKIVLPDPILQGFASAMYLKNISDLSSENTPTAVTPQIRLKEQEQPSSATIDSRDDYNDNDDDDYFANPSETRLRDIRQEFLRSKTLTSTLRPSQNTNGTNTDVNANANQASTGSLLWNAASNPATKMVNPDASKKQQYRLAPTVSEQTPSSWMEDPASIVCDWRMNNSAEEVRE